MRVSDLAGLALCATAFLHAVYSFTRSNVLRRSAAASDYYSLVQGGEKACGDGGGSRHALFMGAFNPFTSRQKNTRVRWFDTELAKFYTYVEGQPMLTHEQELQYGKSLSMWMQVCGVRDRMQAEKMQAMAPDMLGGAEGMPRLPLRLPLSLPLGLPLPLPPALLGSPSMYQHPEADMGTMHEDGQENESGHHRSVLGEGREERDGEAFTASPASVVFPPSVMLAASPKQDPLHLVASELAAASSLRDIEAELGIIPRPPLEGVEEEVGALPDDFDDDKLMACDISEDDLAGAVGCSKSTLLKMQRCAEISRTRLVNSNLKLVLAIVSRYRTSAIPNAELIAEGTRGLSRAVDRYDYSKGFRFATYATWYVHQAISEYVRWRKHPAKMPSRYLVLHRRVKEFTTNFKDEMKRLPEVKEIATALQQPEFDIIKVLTMQTYPILLNAPITLGSTKTDSAKDRTLEDVLASKFRNPTSITGSNDLRNDMEKMMQVNLNDVERDVLRLRLGLDDGRAKAVKEVGRRFKISWKEVRSVEKEALSKLLGSQEIREFVQNYESQPLSSV